MKKYLFILLFLTAKSGSAQTAASYLFSASSVPFESIASIGTISSASGDDFFQTNIPIGFTFNYCGNDYTMLYASSNGYLSLSNILPGSGGPSAVNSQSSLASLADGIGMLCPFWDDLDCTGRPLYYVTTGIAPNRVFVFEWNKAGTYTGGPSPDSLTFQIKLFETSGVIQFCYGHGTYPALSATIGIMNSTTDYQTLNDNSANPVPSSNYFYTDIDTLPANGQLYVWTPLALSAHSLPLKNKRAFLYPDPATSYSTLLLKDEIIHRVECINVMGVTVASFFPQSSEFRLSVKDWDSNFYTLKVEDSKGGLVTIPLIVQH